MNNTELVPLGRVMTALGVSSGTRYEAAMKALNLDVVRSYKTTKGRKFQFVTAQAAAEAERRVAAGEVLIEQAPVGRPRKQIGISTVDTLLSIARANRATAINYRGLMASAKTDAARYRLQAKAARCATIAAALELRASKMMEAA